MSLPRGRQGETLLVTFGVSKVTRRRQHALTSNQTQRQTSKERLKLRAPSHQQLKDFTIHQTPAHQGTTSLPAVLQGRLLAFIGEACERYQRTYRALRNDACESPRYFCGASLDQSASFLLVRSGQVLYCRLSANNVPRQLSLPHRHRKRAFCLAVCRTSSTML
jgi:hypothetical protein